MFLKYNLGSLPKSTLVGRVNYHTPWKHFSRVTDEYIIFIINSGDLYIEEDNTRYHLKKGDFFILEPLKKHVGYKEAICDYYYLHFKTNQIVQFYEDEKNQEIIYQNDSTYFYDEQDFLNYNIFIPKQYSIKDLNLFYQITSILEGAVVDHYSFKHQYPVIVSSRLMEILIHIYRVLLEDNKTHYSHEISKTFFTAQRLRQFIESNLYRSISKEEIVEKFEFNYDYLNRLFKKYSGCSIQHFSKLKKIETAKSLLQSDDIRVSEVAFLVGIDNPYYFSRLFKQTVGLSPIEYYKKARMRKNSHIEEQ